MSDLQLDERGFITACPSCGQRNRVAFSTREARCGRCKSALPPPSQPIEVPNAQAFDALVRDGRQPVVVDFWAPWCGPCRVVHPILEEMAAERDDFRIVSINVDENQQTAGRFDVLSIPTLILFRDGAEAKRVIGAMPKRRLEAELEPALTT
jgi:thioredoxin 1